MKTKITKILFILMNKLIRNKNKSKILEMKQQNLNLTFKIYKMKRMKQYQRIIDFRLKQKFNRKILKV